MADSALEARAREGQWIVYPTRWCDAEVGYVDKATAKTIKVRHTHMYGPAQIRADQLLFVADDEAQARKVADRIISAGAERTRRVAAAEVWLRQETARIIAAAIRQRTVSEDAQDGLYRDGRE